MDLLTSGGAIWFSVPAIIGTLFFVVRTTLLLVGGANDVHHDFGVDVDVDAGADVDTGIDADHGDSGHAFEVLSIQAIAAFLMGFGWGGLAVVRGLGLPALLGVPAGLVTGGAMVWILGKLLKGIYGLQSSGTLPLAAALDEVGTVHIQIPAHRSAKGSIRVVIGDRQRFYHAVTDGDAIESHSRVRVTEINGDNSVTVERVRSELPPPGV